MASYQDADFLPDEPRKRIVADEVTLEKPKDIRPAPSFLPAHYEPYTPKTRLYTCSHYNKCLQYVSNSKFYPNGDPAPTWSCHRCKVPKHYGIEFENLPLKKVTKVCEDCDTEYEVALKYSHISRRCQECIDYDAHKDTCEMCGGPKEASSIYCYGCEPKARIKLKCERCGTRFEAHPKKKHSLCLKCMRRRNVELYGFKTCKGCGGKTRKHSVLDLCRKCYDKMRAENKSPIPKGYNLCACGNKKSNSAEKCKACWTRDKRQGFGGTLSMICAYCDKPFEISYIRWSDTTRRKGIAEADICCSNVCAIRYTGVRKRGGVPKTLRFVCARAGCYKQIKQKTTDVLRKAEKGIPSCCSKSCATSLQKNPKTRLKAGWFGKLQEEIERLKREHAEKRLAREVEYRRRRPRSDDDPSEQADP